MAGPSFDRFLNAKGYQQLTAITTSTALTVPRGANVALIQSEAQNVRWRDDGGAPTATVGMLLQPAFEEFWYTGDLSKLRVIQAAVGAILNVSYYTIA